MLRSAGDQRGHGRAANPPTSLGPPQLTPTLRGLSPGQQEAFLTVPVTPLCEIRHQDKKKGNMTSSRNPQVLWGFALPPRRGLNFQFALGRSSKGFCTWLLMSSLEIRGCVTAPADGKRCPCPLEGAVTHMELLPSPGVEGLGCG
ncbi:hypothetical protein AV530_003587 [Patagioenas fasciata monilis]|uniref:Uncharacterized protein n=1 Tax=Patagioenas fasciata monilis TaxID=372326 RepID=A0A1V4KXR3_PATFA|nr:hypothetical protein AV530_003587 [Patagioenas fasciata monilis]